MPPGVILKALSEPNPVTKTIPAKSVATPIGLLSVLLPPSPALSIISVIVQTVPPVEHVPGVVILKALSEKAPVTKTLPDKSVAMPSGALSVLPPPSPVISMISVIVQTVPPVEHVPGVAILKALLIPRPATKTLPDKSVAMPNPSKNVLPPPSPVLSRISVIVQTVPPVEHVPGVAILKILSEKRAETKTLSDKSVVMPIGKLNALTPSPVISIISVMVPVGVILKTLSEFCPATKTLPDESVAILNGPSSVLTPSPVISIIKNIAYAIGAELKIMINDTTNGKCNLFISINYKFESNTHYVLPSPVNFIVS